MNWLNDWAVGIYQRGPTDEEATTERFLRQLDRTSQRLAEFETTTLALTGAAAGVQRFQTAAAEASENFHNMMKLLEQATQLFEASNHYGVFPLAAEAVAEDAEEHFDRRVALAAKQVRDSAVSGIWTVPAEHAARIRSEITGDVPRHHAREQSDAVPREAA